jgi:hypothetical protein
MISSGVYRFLGMTLTSLGCGPVSHSPWTEFARAGHYRGNELHYDDTTIRALLNHFDGSALGHYYFRLNADRSG